MPLDFDITEHKIADTVTFADRNPLRFIFRHSSVTNDSITVKHIEIPIVFQRNSFFLAFAAFSKTVKFTQLAPNTQVQYSTTLYDLLCFFSENSELMFQKDNRALSVHYFVYLRDELKRSSYSIQRVFSNIEVVLTFAIDRYSSFYKGEYFDEYLDELKRQQPRFPRHEKSPKPTITTIFLSEYTDDEVLISLRRVLTWFMKTMQGIRTDFMKNNSDLARDIFTVLNDRELPYQNSVMTMACADIGSTALSRVNGHYLRAMLNLKNPIVNELMLLAQRNFNKELELGKRFSIWQVRRELEAHFVKKSDLRYLTKDIDRTNFVKARYKSHIVPGKSFNGMRQSVLPVGIMFTSTLAERRAFSWLAASDRIQSSGHDDVTIDDVLMDGFDEQGNPNEIQIRYPKNRARRTFISPIYRRKKDELFDVYLNFFMLRTNAEKMFPIQEREGFLMPSKVNKLYQRPAAICQSTPLPLLLLGLPGTTIYETCMKEVELAEPFLKVLQQSVESSTAYTRSRIRNRQHGTKVENKNKAITMDLIAQTRAVMEDQPDDDPHVSAESSAHNVITHNDVYIDRSDITQKKYADIHTFGSDVGGKIYELAKKMGELVAEEPNYNRTRMIEKLGLKPIGVRNLEGAQELNDLIDIAKSSGLGTGLIGEINRSSETIILQNPLTAAIIISFINHLDRTKKLLVDRPIELKLAISHQIYLQSILERFHRKDVAAGKVLEKQLTLPYRSAK